MLLTKTFPSIRVCFFLTQLRLFRKKSRFNPKERVKEQGKSEHLLFNRSLIIDTFGKIVEANFREIVDKYPTV
jgi:hypothetical protein